MQSTICQSAISCSWAEIEPSVSAYHLAFSPDDQLYVAGPTVTSLIRFGESIKMVKLMFSLKGSVVRKASPSIVMAIYTSRHRCAVVEALFV